MVLDLGARNDRDTFPDSARQEMLDSGARENRCAILRNDTLLEEAPDEHESDEDGDRVEERRRAAANEVRVRARSVGEKDPQSDRQVEVECSLAHRLERGSKEHGTPDEDARGREAKGDALEQLIGIAAVEPAVDRDGEDHRVHRERDAGAHPPHDVGGSGRALVRTRGAEPVAEAFHIGDPTREVERAVDRELDTADRRIDDDRAAALTAEHGFDEPHAGAAVHALEIELDAGESLASNDRFEPLSIRVLVGNGACGRRRDTRSAANVVVSEQARVVQEGVDRLTAGTAEGLDGGAAAVKAGRSCSEGSEAHVVRRASHGPTVLSRLPVGSWLR
jgi:hypothetical protein